MPLRLIFRNLLKHKLRFVLTVAALGMAVFLVCVLRSLVVALDAGVRAAKSDRLVVQSAVSLFVDLPLSYETKIGSVDGVRTLTQFKYFGGTYQEEPGYFAQFGVDAGRLLEIYDEMEIVDGSQEEFARHRTHCLIGKVLAEGRGWKVGQRVPLVSDMFPRADGGPWEFTVAGIYRSRSSTVDESTLFFHFDYLFESVESGSAEGPNGAGVYAVLLEPGADPVAVMRDIDAMFQNGPQRVQTTTEAEFNAQFVTMMGNVPFFLSMIGGGVLAAILLAVVNTMMLAGREQTRDAGVLKSLGFTDGAVSGVLLTQSLIVCLLGGLLGVAAALAVSEPLAAVLGPNVAGFALTSEVILQALLISLALGLLAGLGPAVRARRLEVVEALRAEV